MAMKTMVNWVVILCSSKRAWHFRGMYHFYRQAKRVSQTRNEQKHSSSWANHAWKIWPDIGQAEPERNWESQWKSECYSDRASGRKGKSISAVTWKGQLHTELSGEKLCVWCLGKRQGRYRWCKRYWERSGGWRNRLLLKQPRRLKRMVLWMGSQCHEKGGVYVGQTTWRTMSLETMKEAFRSPSGRR